MACGFTKSLSLLVLAVATGCGKASSSSNAPPPDGAATQNSANADFEQNDPDHLGEILEATTPTTPKAPLFTVKSSDLGDSVSVIGPIGEPLGKIVVVEGRRVPKNELLTQESNWITLSVEKVNGKNLAKPVNIVLRNCRPLQEGEHVAVKGYQYGGFAVVPYEAARIKWQYTEKLHMGLDPDSDSDGWWFRVGFYALRQETLPIGTLPDPGDSHAEPTTSSTSISPHPRVNWSDIGWDLDPPIHVIGPIGEPLGKVVVIEGRPVPKNELHSTPDVDAGAEWFGVERVNGNALPAPVRIQLRDCRPLEKGEYVRIQGYQDGQFDGVTADGTPHGWGFRVTFVVIGPISLWPDHPRRSGK